MTDDALEEVAANVRILIREELAVQHRFGSHPTPAPDCQMCQARAR